MSTIDPAELSALIDGELSPGRAAEVREAIDRDPALRAELARLRDLDAAYRAAASSAAFTPAVSLPAERSSSPAALALALAALLLLRFLPPLLDAPILRVALDAVALAAILVRVIALAARSAREPMPRETAG
jgi:anti-sigma factor RsiW